MKTSNTAKVHDDVIKWKHFPRSWPFVWELIGQNSHHKGHWREVLTFFLICAQTNGWVHNRDAGDLRRHRAHYGVIVMWTLSHQTLVFWKVWTWYIVTPIQCALCKKKMRSYNLSFQRMYIFWLYFIWQSKNRGTWSSGPAQVISMAYYERLDVSNNRQIHCFFNNFFNKNWVAIL